MSNAPDMAVWEPRFRAFLAQQGAADSAHGLDHVQRVVANARRLALAEGAPLAVVLPAAWLHDCVVVAKDSPDRNRASTLAAAAARAFLAGAGYPAAYRDDIVHAIAAHSFSAGIAPRTAAARVVQDADRLDALGAIGLARCLIVGERLGRPLYDPADPFCRQRAPDDLRFTLDHFFTKLLKLPATMQTAAGRREAAERAAFLQAFLAQLAHELGEPPEPAGTVDGETQ